MAFVLAGALIVAGSLLVVFRERFATDNADWQRPFLPQLCTRRMLKLSAFGFGLFGVLVVLAGMVVLAMALHVNPRLP